MPQYMYTAMDSRGKERKGKITGRLPAAQSVILMFQAVLYNLKLELAYRTDEFATVKLAYEHLGHALTHKLVNTFGKLFAPKPSKDSLMKVTRAYLMGLSKEFEKRKDYPATARRLKQEGTVRVQFTVSRDGAISGAVVAKPCPSSSLNESALAAVQAVSKFDPIPAVLGKNEWKMEIPIKYNLH